MCLSSTVLIFPIALLFQSAASDIPRWCLNKIHFLLRNIHYHSMSILNINSMFTNFPSIATCSNKNLCLWSYWHTVNILRERVSYKSNEKLYVQKYSSVFLYSINNKTQLAEQNISNRKNLMEQIAMKAIYSLKSGFKNNEVLLQKRWTFYAVVKKIGQNWKKKTETYEFLPKIQEKHTARLFFCRLL
jgi:hypothetical protein